MYGAVCGNVTAMSYRDSKTELAHFWGEVTCPSCIELKPLPSRADLEQEIVTLKTHINKLEAALVSFVYLDEGEDYRAIGVACEKALADEAEVVGYIKDKLIDGQINL